VTEREGGRELACWKDAAVPRLSLSLSLSFLLLTLFFEVFHGTHAWSASSHINTCLQVQYEGELTFGSGASSSWSR
jgi:hypothetical protein